METNRQVTPLLAPPPQKKKAPLLVTVCRGLFGVHILTLHFKFFNILYSPQSNLSFQKKFLFFPKCPKITQKFTQTAKQWLIRDLACWKRDRDIARKAVFSLRCSRTSHKIPGIPAVLSVCDAIFPFVNKRRHF